MSERIFIIGLPRTGTTSVCHAFLQLGFSCAHTAYTKQCFNQAQVIADTPIFNDYEYLDSLYPGAKFIYLEREADKVAAFNSPIITENAHQLNARGWGF